MAKEEAVKVRPQDAAAQVLADIDKQALTDAQAATQTFVNEMQRILETMPSGFQLPAANVITTMLSKISIDAGTTIPNLLSRYTPVATVMSPPQA